MLAKISSIFSAHPTLAWATVDKICEEKAQESTDATKNGNYEVAAVAIEEHHALAMVYSKLIASRVEWLNANF